jgi:hypothetical protein
MTSRDITIVGFGLLLILALSLDVLGRGGRVRLPTLDAALTRAMRPSLGRVAVLSVWFWLGWHFLAR